MGLHAIQVDLEVTGVIKKKREEKDDSLVFQPLVPSSHRTKSECIISYSKILH
jgi:hypothetical protein